MIAVGIAIPDNIANLLELVVALMIIFLGTRLLYLLLRNRPDIHVHAHSGLSGWRPALIGVVHGLAGSAALTLLVLSEVVRNGTPTFGLVYLLVFGFGSIAGMLIMTTLIGVPISLGARFFQGALLPMRAFAGVWSTIFGLFYAFKVIEKLSAF